jgi:hypothetical protein
VRSPDYDRAVAEMLKMRRCECGAVDCTAEIPISWEEQDAVDHSPYDLWIVAPGHEITSTRRAVKILANDRYSVVRVDEHE